jgi:hypothetical protein
LGFESLRARTVAGDDITGRGEGLAGFTGQDISGTAPSPTPLSVTTCQYGRNASVFIWEGGARMADATSAGDARAAAERMLMDYWNLGARLTIPVDPIFIAKQMGIKVWVAKLEDGVAGMVVNRITGQTGNLPEVR